MKFTLQQFTEIGPFYIDDFPINDRDQSLMFQVFNHLPEHIQGAVISWGFSDTPTKENIFEFMCENQLGMSIDEYYDSDIHKQFMDGLENNDKYCIVVNFEKMKEG